MSYSSSINTLKVRASKIQKAPTSLVLCSEERRFYFEMNFRRQITVVNGDSGKGKTFLIKNLEALIINNATLDIKSGWLSADLAEIVVVDRPKNIPMNLSGRHIFFIDRGDCMSQREADIINAYIAKRNTIVIFARTPSLLMSDTPSVIGDFKTTRVGNINCFAIH